MLEVQIGGSMMMGIDGPEILAKSQVERLVPDENIWVNFNNSWIMKQSWYYWLRIMGK